MEEMLEVFDEKTGMYLQTMSRKAFYEQIKKEYKETGKITKKVKVVRFLLLTSDGRIYIQKRSRNKSENPGLLDKTIGGHVQAGFSYDMAAIMECQEELAIPIMVLSKKDFEAVRDSIDLKVIGIMQKIGNWNNIISKRKLADGSVIEQPLMVSFYIGFYNGSIRFKDGESTGVQTYDIEELETLFEKEPFIFTEDLKFMINKFRQYLVPLKDYCRK